MLVLNTLIILFAYIVKNLTFFYVSCQNRTNRVDNRDRSIRMHISLLITVNYGDSILNSEKLGKTVLVSTNNYIMT